MSNRQRFIVFVALVAVSFVASCDRVPPAPDVLEPNSLFVEEDNRAPWAAPGGPYVSDGTVRFDGSTSSDLDGDDPLTYAWDFGDGHTGSSATPTHTYAADGVYLTTLTVTDARGATSAPGVTTATIAGHADARVVLSGAGNISRCTNDRDESTAALLDELPGWVVALGDNAFPNGALADYEACYDPTWGRHRSRTYAVLGNHEYDLGSADGTFDYFGDHAGPRDRGYHSFDLGAWHIVVLNDNAAHVPFGAGSDQERWLTADLAANRRRCTLAVWHAPMFLSSNSPGFTERPTRRILWEHLYAAGADVVLTGAQHHYERMAPMTPDGMRDDARGIRQFNVGTGGESSAVPTVAIHPQSESRAATYGVLSLTLWEDGYDWEFRSIAGVTFRDAGTGRCH